MFLDKYGIEVNIDDEVILSCYGNCYRAKIFKITDKSIQYLDWNEIDKVYYKNRTISYLKRLRFLQHNIIKL